MRMSKPCRAISQCAVFLLAWGQLAFADSHLPAARDHQPAVPKAPAADCLEALQVADSFLWAWVNRDEAGGLKLVTSRLKKEIDDDSWLRQYVSGLSNPRHEAFEVTNACLSSRPPYTFGVVLYELAEGEATGMTYQGTITVVREGQFWRVDRLPPSSDNQD